MSAVVKEAALNGTLVLTAAQCTDIVQRHLATDAQVLHVTTTTLGDAPAGFLGDHFLVTITTSNNNLRLFVKCVPANPTFSAFAINSGAFKKEIDFFTVLLPALKKYCGETPWCCECYLTTPSSLVMENLATRGFRNLPPQAAMDRAHCEVLLAALASFHAAGIVYEEREKRRLNDVYPELYYEGQWVEDKNHPFKPMYETALKTTCLLIQYLPGMKEGEARYEKVVKRVWKCYRDLCYRMSSGVRDSTKIRSIMGHGDLWANNILFRYGSDASVPVEAKIVDYQLFRYSSPCDDLLCFLHMTTRRHFRDEHRDTLARFYHKALGVELARHRLDVEALLPWRDLHAGLDDSREMGVLMAAMEFPIVYLSGDVVAEILPSPERFQKFWFEDRSEESRRCYETEPGYRELVRESLEELVQYVDKLEV